MDRFWLRNLSFSLGAHGNNKGKVKRSPFGLGLAFPKPMMILFQKLMTLELLCKYVIKLKHIC